MIATIDKAGRLVIPKPIRDAMGLKPGRPLKIDFIDGRIEIEHAPVETRVRIAEDGFPIIETSIDGELAPGQVTDEMLRKALEAVRDEGLTDYL